MDKMTIVFSELYKGFQAYAIFFWLIPMGIGLIIIFYRWIAKVLICPILWMMGFKSPMKQMVKIHKGFKRFVLNPLGLLMGGSLALIYLTAAIVLAPIFIGLPIFMLIAFFKLYPIGTSIFCLFILYYFVLVPRYKKRMNKN